MFSLPLSSAATLYMYILHHSSFLRSSKIVCGCVILFILYSFLYLFKFAAFPQFFHFFIFALLFFCMWEKMEWIFLCLCVVLVLIASTAIFFFFVFLKFSYYIPLFSLLAKGKSVWEKLSSIQFHYTTAREEKKNFWIGFFEFLI